MKNFRIISVVALSIAALTACSSGTPTGTVTVTATETQTETRSVQPEPEPKPEPEPLSGGTDREFLALLGSQVNIYGVDEDSLTELGRTICEVLGRGVDVEDIFMLARSNGLTREEAASIIAAAIVVYCPEKRDLV